LKLVLREASEGGKVLSRNVYWLSSSEDELDWENSDWYYTPVRKYANFSALFGVENATVKISATKEADEANGGRGKKRSRFKVTVENKADIPAVFIRMNIVTAQGEDILPVLFEDNYLTLWPREKMELGVSWEEPTNSAESRLEVSGLNVGKQSLRIRR
jgi:exo-1,4-beta-D-glucosaminidase